MPQENISADLHQHFFPSGHGGPETSDPVPCPKKDMAFVVDPFDQPTTRTKKGMGKEEVLRLLRIVITANQTDSRRALLRLPEHMRADAKRQRALHRQMFVAGRPQRQSEKDRNGRAVTQRFEAQTAKRQFGG